MVTTVGNITNHRLKRVLNSKRTDELEKVLRNLSPGVKSLITEVVIDMCDLYRKAVEETLPMVYATKERLREMYRVSSKDEARKRLELIISTLESTDDGELISWGRTLSRWKEPILNYWNSRSTNGFMEGMHNKMKFIKRISFGFRNKKVFIYKIMLSVMIFSILFNRL